MRFKYTIEYPTRVIAIGTTKNNLKFEGIARCNPKDKFDAKKGRRIAKLRAEQKQLKNISNKIDNELAEKTKEFNIIIEELDRKQTRLAKTQKRIREIKKEIEELK